MNEQEINTEIDSWISKISKYVISRSSPLVSSDTQKDGRILLLLSALSSLLYLGIVQLKYNVIGLEVKFINLGFIPIIMEVVCLYFALSFIINAYSELKIWQFKTLVKDSDDEQPLNAIKRAIEEISKKQDEIFDNYEKLIAKATQESEVETPIEMLPEISDINKKKELSIELEDRFERLKKLDLILDVYIASRDEELAKLKVESVILDFKMKSYDNVIPSMVKVYKFKYFISIAFPLLSFLVSILVMLFFIIKNLKH